MLPQSSADKHLSWNPKDYPRNSINLAYMYSQSSLTRLLSRSPEWTSISDKEKEKLGLSFDDDGEFW